ncbi:pyridoxamine 5'-phosphate oxidase family protein [Streptacidiphilus sp. EB129]|uniref:pyridoxamine 5'-phosphate oxidase family protein n=1 Tax=Streptacidiphilus sp. EB129 TaxID=3156262 RepID=UPI003515655B
MTSHGDLTSLSDDAALRLLTRIPVGRVVFTRHALPDVLPVRFSLDYAGVVLISPPTGSRLAEALAGSVVVLQVEELDPVTLSGASVVVHGRVRPGLADGPLRMVPELIRGTVLRGSDGAAARPGPADR